MNDKPKTVWVTKYALTAGIKECLVEETFPESRLRVRYSSGVEMYIRPRDYVFTWELASQSIDGIKARRLASLRKQMARIMEKVVNVYPYKPES